MGAEGLTGKGRAKFLKAEGQEDIADLEKVLERMNERLESGLFSKDRKGNLSAVGKRQKTQLEQRIATVRKKLETKQKEVAAIGHKHLAFEHRLRLLQLVFRAFSSTIQQV